MKKEVKPKTWEEVLTEISERDGSKPMKEKIRLAKIEFKSLKS